jgi:Domain of unknown function (DUF5667)
MTSESDELDEYGKRILAPIYPAPRLSTDEAKREKTRYLQQAEILRHGSIAQAGGAEKVDQAGNKWLFAIRPLLQMKFVLAIIVALVILLGSSLTVYAAQSSLPDEFLYPVKSLSEDLLLSMAGSSQAKLNLTLEYTGRRVNEFSHLLEMGKAVPEQSSARFQNELDTALQLASEMDDAQMLKALGQIKRQAESQGISLEELISKLPLQARPAIARLQSILQEQVNLSSYGEQDPQAFRSEIRARQHRHPGQSRSTPEDDNSEEKQMKHTATQIPMDNGNGHGNNQVKPTDSSGKGGPGSGKGNPNPGSENHNPELTLTPSP